MTPPEKLNPEPFWRIVYLLLKSARMRSAGRLRKQRELQKAKGKPGSGPSLIGFFFMLFGTLYAHGLAASIIYWFVCSGEILDQEKIGKVVVSQSFFESASKFEQVSAQDKLAARGDLETRIVDESLSSEREYGTPHAAREELLSREADKNGGKNLVSYNEAATGLTGLLKGGSTAKMLGSLILLFWLAMMVCQGEGAEMDFQRRHHPMWEWLLSHPVQTGAIFFAEMITPIVANPVYISAPLFVGILYGLTYDVGSGFYAAFLIGIPISVSLACLGKAMEIATILSFSVRTRGAFIGLMGWFGLIAPIFLFIMMAHSKQAGFAIGKALETLTVLPWPWLSLFLGAQFDGTFSFIRGLLYCWSFSACILIFAVWFSAWGASKGLSGNFGAQDSIPIGKLKASRFNKEPLYRKEYLWFVRDRSALIQAILIPISGAALEYFNFRNAIQQMGNAWNTIGGGAILFGTYFLWILGPKSLASEGNALWMALTWPRGLESLLKAKARLWSLISSGLVFVILGFDLFIHPANFIGILLVGIAWFYFSQSMALKAVTLVSVPASNGVADRVPSGRRWAASLGMLTFATGVFMEQWNLAVVGIVYSFITAGAMWENFRARLPYLYDPWSEKVPPPPTLMNAMIGISILVELSGVSNALAVVASRENMAAMHVITYGLSAVVVSMGMIMYLDNHGVSLEKVWKWDAGEMSGWGVKVLKKSAIASLSTGITAGLVLGLFGTVYIAILEFIPATAHILNEGKSLALKYPGLAIGDAIAAIFIAPLAEEYLFRGLLYRALDQEWGGWRAILGSAAFFAIYHSPIAWLPVGLLGATSAILFKRTGRLAPSVLLHMVYNTVVTLTNS